MSKADTSYKNKDYISYAASITPSDRQLKWQQLEFYGFAHFGMNTFTDKEWGDGNDSPMLFAPYSFDANQWVDAVKSAGMKGLILTCKHHDGFCLWQSAYTEYSVKNSPWKEGKGDVVREVADACKKANIKFGVYLSPWDRHEASYGMGKAYDDYYVNQLTELAANYGEIFCFWFDGACGEGKNGKKQYYDWDRYYETIRRLQPNAVISICGPDVRWCGNEAGHCRESEWSVVPAELTYAERTMEISQQEDNTKFRKKINSEDEDLGSREKIKDEKELVWYPAEVDTSIRPGWFYHKNEDNKVKTADELFEIYLKSVGANASLLLNIPPTTQGLISEADCKSLKELGKKINNLFKENITKKATVSVTSFAYGHPISMATDNLEETYWEALEGQEKNTIAFEFEDKTEISCVVLAEYLPKGQRIECGEIWGDEKLICNFTVVGNKRICYFDSVDVKKVEIKIISSRREPIMKTLSLYK